MESRITAWQSALEQAAEHARTYVTSGHLPTALVALATSTERIGTRACNETGEEATDLYDRRFALASITKAITGTGMACLADEGKLDYTKPVAEYIPEFGADEQRKRITVGDVFTHTTGLPSKFAPTMADGGCSSEVCRRWLLEDQLQSEPGTEMAYTSYTYQILNWLVERLTGGTMSSFLEEHVYGPCGMTGTSFHPGPEGGRVPTVDHPVKDAEHMEQFCKLEVSGGGLWSTAPDLLSLGQALLQPGKLLRPETFRLVTATRSTAPRRDTGEPSARTWGWVKEEQPAFPCQPESGFYHGGATGTLLYLDPPRDLLFVFLSSRWGSGNDHAFATLNVVYEALGLEGGS